MVNRRLFALMLLMALAIPAGDGAFASDDGGGGGDSGGSGGSGGGDSDGGDSDGGDDGGKDDGGDDGGKDDDGDKDDDSKDKSGKNRSRSRNDDDDDDRIRKAVQSGRAKPLRSILANVRSRYKGQVVRVRLTGRGNKLVYRIRIIDNRNALIEVQVEAATGRIMTPAGFY